jgi:putative protease
MKNEIELLAPAGSWESFTAAVENGADAIYMGGQLFNARQYAANFDDKELERAIDYAHVRGVRIYMTLNTLLDDYEIEQALEYLRHPYEWGIDGLIVQDLGLAAGVRRYFQGLDLHASTQMTTYNLEGVNILEKLGFKRVVLARELSLAEIEAIATKTGVEIEIFIHGALCVSYSGQCLMSSMIGGRSGNRGKCAQPCRQKYDLVTLESGEAKMSRKYLLSPRDLCSAEFLDKISTSGVKSLKIEGRMKSPEYVAIVVGTYRKYLDRALEKTEKDDYHFESEDSTRLAQIFNRGGFSKGYFFGKTGKDMMSFEKPKNWGVYLGETVSYQPGSKLLKIKLNSDIGIGDGVEIWNKDDESPGNIITEIRVNGKNTGSAQKGQTVEIGSLSGKIAKGVKVYKTSDKKLNEAARESFSGKLLRRTPLYGAITIEEGGRAEFEVTDTKGNKASAKSDMIAETALVKPLQEDRVLEQLSKTGATPFYFNKIDKRNKG